jgi:hypothetical protein
LSIPYENRFVVVFDPNFSIAFSPSTKEIHYFLHSPLFHIIA